MTAQVQKTSSVVQDTLDRPLCSLRVSVIDRCDLRCRYCMPEEDYDWLPKDDILSFAEIERAVDAFCRLGVRSVRLTGGEPLLRADLAGLVARIAAMPLVEDLALTTNATQLAHRAGELRAAGLQRVTISLDSLVPERFAALARRDMHAKVIAGIRAAAAAGFDALKINSVVMRDFNDDELVGLLEFGREVGAEVRFIEYMDVGGATHWSQGAVVSQGEILTRLEAHYGPIEREADQGSAPAARFHLGDGTRFGIVASVSEPFCGACDRSRLTADGWWYLCLYAQRGIDLKPWLHERVDQEELVQQIRAGWGERTDKSAEERRDDPQRGALFQVEELQADPHREMHTRGG
ncbi:MAG: GTP 3',8-cyclase MoaA [Candidatus Latescibacterota bacterium]|nr:GTP 3',8-cyclase MoaA [Candidatus Latescibacterota bacterium]